MNGAIFLDRDGVIIENREDYVKSWAEVDFLPGVFEGLHRLREAGWRTVMVTNQSAVGRGIITVAFVEEVHGRMSEEIVAHDGRIDAVYFCPHHPQANCLCRKPAPGMLRQAAEELGIDLGRSYMVGDALTDLEAARAVGATGILVLTGRGREQAAILAKRGETHAPIVADLEAAVEYILANERGNS